MIFRALLPFSVAFVSRPSVTDKKNLVPQQGRDASEQRTSRGATLVEPRRASEREQDSTHCTPVNGGHRGAYASDHRIDRFSAPGSEANFGPCRAKGLAPGDLFSLRAATGVLFLVRAGSLFVSFALYTTREDLRTAIGHLSYREAGAWRTIAGEGVVE